MFTVNKVQGHRNVTTMQEPKSEILLIGISQTFVSAFDLKTYDSKVLQVMAEDGTKNHVLQESGQRYDVFFKTVLL